MIKYLFPGLKDSRILATIERFFKSPFYVALMGLVTLFSAIFGTELFAYWFYVIVAGWIPWLLCSDLSSALAPMVFAYVSFSYKNNNVNVDGLFKNDVFVTNFIILVINVCVIFISRVILDIIYRKKKYQLPKLGIGFLLLLIAFLFGGITSNYYETKSFVFGLVLGGIMLGAYLFILFEIDWDNFDFKYVAWIFMILGIVVALELGFTYYRVLVIDKVESFKRTYLTIGWGFYNNIGCELAFSIPAALYLFRRYKKGYLFFIPFSIILLALLFSQSRGSILFGGISTLISIALLFIVSNKEKRVQTGIYLLIMLLLSILMFLIFKDTFVKLFKTVVDTLKSKDLNDLSSARLNIYKRGLNDFLEQPIFGVGFMKCDAYLYDNVHTSFLPARYHNTYVQLLAATGLFGILSYIFHRYQTVKMAIKNRNIESIFIMLFVLALLLTSMTDNHFFNIGPNIQYAILLGSLEGLAIKEIKNENN